MSLSVNRNLSGSTEPSADGHGSTPRTPPLSSSLLGIRNGEAAGCRLKLKRGPPPPHAGWGDPLNGEGEVADLRVAGRKHQEAACKRSELQSRGATWCPLDSKQWPPL